MLGLTSFLALTAIQFSVLAVAGPSLEERAGNVCNRGVYSELIPYLSSYTQAQAFCTSAYPIKCTNGGHRHRTTSTRTSSTTSPATTVQVVTRGVEARNRAGLTSSAWSRCHRQSANVISTLCSCIETAQACSSSTSSTATPGTSMSFTLSPVSTTSANSTISADPTASANSTISANSTMTANATVTANSTIPADPTASANSTASTTNTTTSTTTANTTSPTPTCNGNYVTAGTTQYCQFFAGYQVRNNYLFYSIQFYPSETTDSNAIQECANYVSSLGSSVAPTFQVFYVPSENRWHCDSSQTANCNSTFTANTYVNQIYQYNAVGSTCA